MGQSSYRASTHAFEFDDRIVLTFLTLHKTNKQTRNHTIHSLGTLFLKNFIL